MPNPPPQRLPDETVDPDLSAQDHPLSEEEQLEQALQESMDGSDALSVTLPGSDDRPVPSSGFSGGED